MWGTLGQTGLALAIVTPLFLFGVYGQAAWFLGEKRTAALQFSASLSLVAAVVLAYLTTGTSAWWPLALGITAWVAIWAWSIKTAWDVRLEERWPST